MRRRPGRSARPGSVTEGPDRRRAVASPGPSAVAALVGDEQLRGGVVRRPQHSPST